MMNYSNSKVCVKFLKTYGEKFKIRLVEGWDIHYLNDKIGTNDL